MIMICVWSLLGLMLAGQTVEEAKADFDHQARALEANFLKYMQYQAEVFAEKTKDTKGDRTLAFTTRLQKTHTVWLAWAARQARDQIASEPVGKQEALLWTSKAWLYEQKSRDLGREVGGPENTSQPLIDDTRVNIGPIGKGFEPYVGNVGASKGLFALQWLDEKSVRGGFASFDMMRTFRVFGDLTEEGVIEFLFVVSGEDEGIEVKMKKESVGDRTFWRGRAGMVGDVFFEKLAMSVEEGEVTDSIYEGRSGRSRLSLKLGWKPSGQVQGMWVELGVGEPNVLKGVNYAPQYLYLNYWKDGGLEFEGATVPAMWFLRKMEKKPERWTGKAIYLNGHEELLSFSK